jgi:hypothetical protein
MEKKNCKSCKENNPQKIPAIILGAYFLISGIVVGIYIVKQILNSF